MIFSLIHLFFFFSGQLIKANLQVARLIFVPNSKICPAIVKIPVKIESPIGVFFFANMITLTPGTLSLHLDETENGRFLYVHILHTDDPDVEIERIKSGLEKRLMRCLM